MKKDKFKKRYNLGGLLGDSSGKEKEVSSKDIPAYIAKGYYTSTELPIGINDYYSVTNDNPDDSTKYYLIPQDRDKGVNYQPNFTTGGYQREYDGGQILRNSEAPKHFLGAALGVAQLGMQIGQGIKAKQLAQEQAKEEKKLLKNSAEQNALNNSKELLSIYPTSGLEGSISYANGGNLPNDINVEKDNVMKLSDDLFLFKGNNHKNGGIPIDTNNDMIEDAEVEDEEVYQEEGNRVYSNSIKPSKDVISKIKNDLGFSVKGTYADVSKKIAKFKSKIEDKDDNIFSKNTKNLLLPRIDESLDLLFQNQELSKVENNNNNNNEVRKFQEGGFLDFLGENTGHIANVGSLIGNLATVNNIRTNRKPISEVAPSYYFDNSIYQNERNRLKNTTDTLTQRLIGSTSQGIGDDINKLKASDIEAGNRISAAEKSDESQAQREYSGRLSDIQGRNVQQANIVNRENMQAGNEKLAAKNQAVNAFVQGVIGNEATRQGNILERDKMFLNYLGQNESGVGDRQIEQLGESRTKRLFGRDEYQNFVDKGIFGEEPSSTTPTGTELERRKRFRQNPMMYRRNLSGANRSILSLPQ